MLWGHYHWKKGIDSAFNLQKELTAQTSALHWVFFDLQFIGHGWKENFSLFPALFLTHFLFVLFFIAPAKGCPVRKQQGEILPLNAPNINIFGQSASCYLTKSMSCWTNCKFSRENVKNVAFKQCFCVFLDTCSSPTIWMSWEIWLKTFWTLRIVTSQTRFGNKYGYFALNLHPICVTFVTLVQMVHLMWNSGFIVLVCAINEFCHNMPAEHSKSKQKC